MKTWDTNSMDVEVHKPEVITSTDAARLIVIDLPAGEQLQEHQVHERAWVLVLDGELEITGSESVTGGRGLLAEFDPAERHEVSAKTDTRLLLFLAPWPGEGHPSAA
jgi:redox-sensitive bicupin YhaK (pirin superfamily)